MELSSFSKMIAKTDLPNKIQLENLVHLIRRKGLVWLWRSGLGPLFNASPTLFGSQLVVIFPDSNLTFPLVYSESENEILTLISERDYRSCAEALAANSIIQVWMNNGWFNATAELLSSDETNNRLLQITPEQFFGKIGVFLRGEGEEVNIRLMSIKKISPRTGAKGPGQYAWVWAALSGYLFFALLFKRARK